VEGDWVCYGCGHEKPKAERGSFLRVRGERGRYCAPCRAGIEDTVAAFSHPADLRELNRFDAPILDWR